MSIVIVIMGPEIDHLKTPRRGGGSQNRHLMLATVGSHFWQLLLFFDYPCKSIYVNLAHVIGLELFILVILQKIINRSRYLCCHQITRLTNLCTLVLHPVLLLASDRFEPGAPLRLT
jgi:hypothetical protein